MRALPSVTNVLDEYISLCLNLARAMIAGGSTHVRSKSVDGSAMKENAWRKAYAGGLGLAFQPAVGLELLDELGDAGVALRHLFPSHDAPSRRRASNRRDRRVTPL